MSWFQLDASTIACRVHSEGDGARPLSLPGSMLRGAAGFAVVSVAGFAPWALFGRWLGAQLGEGGVFGVCAVVFILLSGVMLHPLIIGPGSIAIFYKLFGVTFPAYVLAWIIAWTCLGGDLGNLAGLLAGAVVLGWMLSRAFEAPRAAWGAITAIFVLSAVGFFAGAKVEAMAVGAQETIARLVWGACFGAGFGAGLGVAFYLCQGEVREFLREEAARIEAAKK